MSKKQGQDWALRFNGASKEHIVFETSKEAALDSFLEGSTYDVLRSLGEHCPVDVRDTVTGEIFEAEVDIEMEPQFEVTW